MNCIENFANTQKAIAVDSRDCELKKYVNLTWKNIINNEL